MRKLVDAIADGVPARTRRDEFASPEAREDELNDLVISETAPQLFIHANLPEVYRRRVADLHVALQEEAAGDEATALIRSLVDEIVHSPEEGRLRIDLKGKLAGILRLCASGKKSGTHSGTGLMEQVKMVAGERYGLNHNFPPLVVFV